MPNVIEIRVHLGDMTALFRTPCKFLGPHGEHLGTVVHMHFDGTCTVAVVELLEHVSIQNYAAIARECEFNPNPHDELRRTLDGCLAELMHKARQGKIK